MTVVVKKIGGSLAVVIPKAVAREMQLSEGVALEVSSTAAAVTLRKQDRRPRRPLSEVLAGIDPSAYRRHNQDLSGGPPIGREVW